MVTHLVGTPELPSPGGAYSHAAISRGLVFTAGQVGRDSATGVIPTELEDQVRLAITNLEAVLRAAGSSLALVLKTTCYLADIATFGRFDTIYAECFTEPRPARSTVGVALADGLLFEIEAVAEVGESQ